MAQVKVTCGWCKNDFSTENSSNDHGFGDTICPNCGRKVKSSKKNYNENGTGVKSELKDGDIV